jgi:8-oxo-dGTP pyrophosphatase MutT (NUDIX family)
MSSHKLARSIKALVVLDNKILLVRENNNRYGLPGGGVKRSETDHQALLRELKEELGLLSSDVRIAPTPSHTLDAIAGRRGACQFIFYPVRITAVIPGAELSATWASLDDLPVLDMFSGLRPILEDTLRAAASR